MTTLGSMVSAAAVFGLVAASAVQAQTPTPTTATSTCVGDCKDIMKVEITDLVLGVNIALGTQPVMACPAFDCMHNDMVTISCLVQGVNNALNGCGFVTATPTATSPGGVPTATVTPTPTTNAGTVRVFTIGHLVDPLVTDDTAGSGLFNLNLLGHGNVASMMSSGPLTLVLGPPNASGVAPLTLQSDVTVSIDISLNSSCACLKFLAAGSTGSISCNGGTAYDTIVTQDTNSVDETAWTAQTGQGSPAGPGNGALLVMGLFQDFSGTTCAQKDCSTATYDNAANPFPFTTTQSTTVKMGAGAGPWTTTAGGGGVPAPFDCANFGTPGSGGVLVSGVAMTDPVGGATADSLRFSE